MKRGTQWSRGPWVWRWVTSHICGIGEGNGVAQIGYADHLPLTDQVAARVAGKESELEFESPLPGRAGDSDNELAINLILEHHEGASIEEIDRNMVAGRARARERLRQYRGRVVRLADRLFEVRNVNAAEFLRLMCP
jgi:hypothetical protein